MITCTCNTNHFSCIHCET